MFRRPLVFVLALAVGDYFLWTWSLNGNHDVIALIAGLTLPPLVIAAVWLLALTGARFLGDLTRRSDGPPVQKHARSAHAEPVVPAEQPSRKLAA